MQGGRILGQSTGLTLGFVKVRYRGLAKNTGQIVTLFALANLWLTRKRLALMGEVRTKTGNTGLPTV